MKYKGGIDDRRNKNGILHNAFMRRIFLGWYFIFSDIEINCIRTYRNST